MDVEIEAQQAEVAWDNEATPSLPSVDSELDAVSLNVLIASRGHYGPSGPGRSARK